MKLPTSIKSFLVDLDGTLYFKGTQIFKAAETIKLLRQRDFQLRFLTNTDSILPTEMIRQVRSYGISIEESELFTPIVALKNFFKDNPNLTFYPLTTQTVRMTFEGMNIDDQKPDYVVVSDFHDQVSYAEIDKVFRMIDNGSTIVCSGKGRKFIRQDGVHIDTGAFVAMFEYASKKSSQVFGKPEARYFQLALSTLGHNPAETAIVGDDIYTDILGSINIKALSILVKTGKYNKINLKKTGIRPDFIINSISEITELLF